MTAARQYRPHYTVEDYRLWPGDWELWFGTAVAMSPSPFGPQKRVVSELAFRIQSAIRSHACDCVLYTGLDWIVQEDTVIRPDIMVVCGPQPDQHLRRPPNLTVEVVSPSTVDKDWGPKQDLYAQQGVSHYLIVDPDTNRLHWLRLIEDRYEVQSDAEQLNLHIHEGCDIQIVW